MTRERGRPFATTHDAIVEAAFDLFRDVGFAETTMPMIAERAGIGRSTLFRYFSNRAAILWYTLGEVTEDLRANLAGQPADADLVDGAFAAYREIWTRRADLTPIGREIVRTLETAPPELTGKWAAYATAQELFHRYVLDRTGLPEQDTAARAAAAAIWAAIWAAATSYALSEGEPIEAHLDRARAAIEIRLPTLGEREARPVRAEAARRPRA